MDKNKLEAVLVGLLALFLLYMSYTQLAETTPFFLKRENAIEAQRVPVEQPETEEEEQIDG